MWVTASIIHRDLGLSANQLRSMIQRGRLQRGIHWATVDRKRQRQGGTGEDGGDVMDRMRLYSEMIYDSDGSYVLYEDAIKEITRLRKALDDAQAYLRNDAFNRRVKSALEIIDDALEMRMEEM